jgi:hypothetical protein
MSKRLKRRAAKRVKPPKKPRHLHVKTVFGSSLLNAKSLVYVKLGDEYARKRVDDLAKGEEVLYRKDGIPDITLDDVSDALAMSDRYAATTPVLFERLADGSYSTAFSWALFQGMAENEGWPESISGDGTITASISKSMLPDLNDRQIEAATDVIRKRLVQSEAPAVSESHIRHGWLGGKVIAPRNRGSVVAALEPMAPGLRKLLSDAFDESYKLYVVIRQTVMRSISTLLKGNTKEGASSPRPEDRGNGISVRPEIKLIAEHFASDIDTVFASGNILSVEPVSGTCQQTEEGVLAKGVVTKKLDESQIRIKTLPMILLEASPINCIVHRIAYEFLRREKIRLPATVSEDKGFPNTTTPYFLMTALSMVMGQMAYQRNMERSYQRLEDRGAVQLSKFFEVIRMTKANDFELDLATRFLHKLQNGELDSLYITPEGELLRLIEHHFRLKNSLPFEYRYRTCLSTIIMDKRHHMELIGEKVSTAVEEAEMRKVDERLSSFGWSPDSATLDTTPAYVAIDEFIEIFSPLWFKVNDGEISPEMALSKRGVDVQRLKLRGTLMSDHTAEEIIREAGFPASVHLFPRGVRRIKPVL